MPIILKPEKAYNAFFSVAAGGAREKNFHLKRNLLDYMVGDVKKTRAALGSLAGEELDAYLSAYDQLAARQYKLLANKETLKKAAPKLDDRFTSEVATQRLGGSVRTSHFFTDRRLEQRRHHHFRRHRD